MKTIGLNGRNLTIEDVVEVSRERAQVELAAGAREQVMASRKFIDDMVAANRLIYGVNTGTGPNVHHTVPADKVNQLQTNIVRMLCCGMGEPLPQAVVRATMTVRANSLSRGHSGIRIEVLELLLAMINRGVHPVIYEQGSVGASGDLVPLAHMAAVLMGEGEAEYQGQRLPSVQALAQAGLQPLSLTAKEGLALVNGTSLMTAIGALAVGDTDQLIAVAEGTSAFALEMLLGTYEPYDPRIQELRPYPGQIATARNVLALVQGSGYVRSPEGLRDELELERSHLPQDDGHTLSHDLQDPYSLRCVPQIIGAVRDAVTFVRSIVGTDLNAVSDNPLIFSDDATVLHGGNFQGHHVAMAMDVLSLALNQLGILAERRLARYVDDKYSLGLRPYLTQGLPGLNNGMMGVQLMATSLVAENRLHATPASIQSIPTNGNNQDVVSMGALAARKNMPLVKNTRRLLAVELFALCQAAEERGLDKLGRASRALYDYVRALVPALVEDRPLADDLRRLADSLGDGILAERIGVLVGTPPAARRVTSVG